MKVWATALAIQVGTIVVMPIGMRLVSGMFGGPFDDFRDVAQEFGLLPFEPQANRVAWVFIWIFASIGNEAMNTMLRHLRSLPLRAWTLTAVFMTGSLITWINAWMVLGVFHFVLLGRPPDTWRLPLLVGYLGFDCLMRSLQLRWNTRFWAVILMLVVVFPIGLAAVALHLSLDSVLLSLGPVAVLIAAWLSHWALTTNRAAYARKPRRGPLGVEAPG